MSALHTAVADPIQDEVFDTTMLCAADYPATGVRWLWPGRIPIGKVSLITGDPGMGKSLLALDVAARVSRGAAFPDQSKPTTKPGSVLILSADDDLADTIRPRLDAAGADPRRVFVLPSIVDLRHELGKLRAAVERAPDCRLIVVDPINAFVGPGDSHFHTIVRRVLEPLARLAAEKGLAVLAISHLRKHDGAAIQRAAGSMGIVAASRAVWTVCRDPDQPGRQLLLPLKNNFVAKSTGLAYRITSQPVALPSTDVPPLPGAGAYPALEWDAGEVTTTVVEAVTAAQKRRGPEATELNAAADWLRDQLAAGPRPALMILMEASQAGFRERTLRRALFTMGGKTTKRSWEEGWCWSLPESTSGGTEPNALASGEQPESVPSDHPRLAPTAHLGKNSVPEADIVAPTSPQSTIPHPQSAIPAPLTSKIKHQTSEIPTPQSPAPSTPSETWPLRENPAVFASETWPLRESGASRQHRNDPVGPREPDLTDEQVDSIARHLADQLQESLASPPDPPPQPATGFKDPPDHLRIAHETNSLRQETSHDQPRNGCRV